MMGSTETVVAISALAAKIAEGRTDEDLAMLSALFVQLGDTIATIITHRQSFKIDNTQ